MNHTDPTNGYGYYVARESEHWEAGIRAGRASRTREESEASLTVHGPMYPKHTQSCHCQSLTHSVTSLQLIYLSIRSRQRVRDCVMVRNRVL